MYNNLNNNYLELTPCDEISFPSNKKLSNISEHYKANSIKIQNVINYFTNNNSKDNLRKAILFDGMIKKNKKSSSENYSKITPYFIPFVFSIPMLENIQSVDLFKIIENIGGKSFISTSSKNLLHTLLTESNMYDYLNLYENNNIEQKMKLASFIQILMFNITSTFFIDNNNNNSPQMVNNDILTELISIINSPFTYKGIFPHIDNLTYGQKMFRKISIIFGKLPVMFEKSFIIDKNLPIQIQPIIDDNNNITSVSADSFVIDVTNSLLYSKIKSSDNDSFQITKALDERIYHFNNGVPQYLKFNKSIYYLPVIIQRKERPNYNANFLANHAKFKEDNFRTLEKNNSQINNDELFKGFEYNGVKYVTYMIIGSYKGDFGKIEEFCLININKNIYMLNKHFDVKYFNVSDPCNEDSKNSSSDEKYFKQIINSSTNYNKNVGCSFDATNSQKDSYDEYNGTSTKLMFSSSDCNQPIPINTETLKENPSFFASNADLIIYLTDAGPFKNNKNIDIDLNL